MYTTSQAAAKLGMHARTVRRICAAHAIGARLSDRVRVLTDADLRRLAGLKKSRGNPAFVRRKSNGG